MKKIFEYLRHNTHLFLLLYALIYIPWFCWLEEKVNINSNFHVIHMALDDYIPFCEFFVIPYYLWFIYMAAGIIFIAFTDGKLCWRLGIFLITGMTPTNLFPSIHVYNSLAIYFGLAHSQKLQNKKWIKNAALVLTVCIILSTMFLKQHSVFDVLTAFALAAFMYSVCYGSIAVAFERRRQKRIPAGQI